MKACGLLFSCLALLVGCDAHEYVRGEIAGGDATCKIRIVRPGSTGGPEYEVEGKFEVSFLYGPGRPPRSSYHAEVSCSGGPWTRVGPSDAFARSGSIDLGVIQPPLARPR